MDFQTLIQEASISIVSVVALVYVTYLFIKELREQSKQHAEMIINRTMRHEEAMLEREKALRELEREVRITLTDHIVQSNIALNESSRVIARAVDALDKN